MKFKQLLISLKKMKYIHELHVIIPWRIELHCVQHWRTGGGAWGGGGRLPPQMKLEISLKVINTPAPQYFLTV